MLFSNNFILQMVWKMTYYQLKPRVKNVNETLIKMQACENDGCKMAAILFTLEHIKKYIISCKTFLVGSYINIETKSSKPHNTETIALFQYPHIGVCLGSVKHVPKVSITTLKFTFVAANLKERGHT